MPPKGKGTGRGKAKAKAEAAPAPPLPVTDESRPGEFSLELRHGEVDRANSDHLHKVEEALGTLSGHALFHNMVQEDPLGITATVGESGNLQPFDLDVYHRAIASAGKYTAGGNLFWIDFRWSATPGVPVRSEAVKRMAAQHFHTPIEYPGMLHVAVTTDYEPLNHRGSWHSVSPEEMAHAMLFAVADAVRREQDNLELLGAWKRCMLCTTFRFTVLANAEKRTWYALQQREDVSHHQLLVHRSCFQRCHEMARLRHRLQETVSGCDSTDAL